ncbi:M23 family metallopeptidase [Mesorhizobium sp. SB112]|uniref:M23 family metallopeptidase n=1 Tax=Mesorhizobium sp. SB112 TaxID=3151853 RepID=UPI003263A426
MYLLLAIFLGTHVLLPLFFIYGLWAGVKDRSDWLMHAIYGGIFMVFLFVLGQWFWISYEVRYASLAVYAIAVAASGWRHRDKSWRAPGTRPFLLRHGFMAFMCVVFIGMIGYAISGYHPEHEPVELAMPLEDGRYVVAHGGDNSLINYHNSHNSQRYALDILRLNGSGARASGLFPSELESYAIFGAKISSPCNGIVRAVSDGAADNVPGETATGDPAGNHIVIECQGVQVLLAHFVKDSIAVSQNQNVAIGDALGLAGNSGNSTEPHLHIHAFRSADGDYQSGEGVPVSFGGRFLVRNSTF